MEREGDVESSIIRMRPRPEIEIEDDGGIESEDEDWCSKKLDTFKAGDTIHILDLLFPPESDRDFLITNDDHKVRVDDLKGKTIVVYVVPLQERYLDTQTTSDLINAYNELLPMSDVVFVFVAVQIVRNRHEVDKAYFDYLMSTMPFPTIPFDDKPARDSVAKAFFITPRLVDYYYNYLPYWSIIDPADTVVATTITCSSLFNVYGGAELYPFEQERIRSLYWGPCLNPRELLKNLDQLLTSPSHNYLLSWNGNMVPVSSLEDKVVGLYFCSDHPDPDVMVMIEKVYNQAIDKGLAFQIVQTTFRSCPDTLKPVKCDWLTLHFNDPRHKKLLRIFHKVDKQDGELFLKDLLIIADRRNGVRFEYSGVEILQNYGINGYPFTQQALADFEYGKQKDLGKLKLLFPPGKCRLFWRGTSKCDVSELSGKQVLLYFAKHSDIKSCARLAKAVDTLKSKYNDAQHHDVKEDKFEVVYVSSDKDSYLFSECVKDMPWLVYPYSERLACELSSNFFKFGDGAYAAFDVNGELIAKGPVFNAEAEFRKLRFPFAQADLKGKISAEVVSKCMLKWYYDPYVDDRETYQFMNS